MSLTIPIETSARHIHITQEDFETQFGKGAKPTFAKELSQPGQYACKERLTVRRPEKGGSKGRDPRSLQERDPGGDLRDRRPPSRDQERDPPVRRPGRDPRLHPHRARREDRTGAGRDRGQRHIHMTPVDAIRAHVKDNDIVFVITTSYERSLIFSDVGRARQPVLSRWPCMWIRTEANAFANEDHPTGVILKLFKRTYLQPAVLGGRAPGRHPPVEIDN